MALDLARRVAAGEYGCCIGMGCVLRSDGCFSVVAGEHGRKLGYDVRDLGCWSTLVCTNDVFRVVRWAAL
jgi:hypothetical protein